MEGRVLTIKKSIVLYTFAVMMLLCFITISILAFTVFRRPVLWFFSFCLCAGAYDLLRGFLLNIDNSVYLGNLLINTGSVGILTAFINLKAYTPLLFAIGFALASLIMYIVYRQSFHMILAFSIIFVASYGFLLIKSLISFQIFIAFVVVFLVLLIVSILTQINWRK